MVGQLLFLIITTNKVFQMYYSDEWWQNSKNNCLDNNLEFRKQFWGALGLINEIRVTT